LALGGSGVLWQPVAADPRRSPMRGWPLPCRPILSWLISEGRPRRRRPLF